MRSWLVGMLLLVTALTGCGGASAPEASGPGGSEKVIDLLAELDVIDATVEHDAGEGFVTASTGDAVGVGNVVHTDASGFAQLDYVDGSLARLGPETTLTVVALAQDAGPVDTRVDLDVGRLWNRVEGVTESEGRFEVGTTVGVAAVRGTAFDVACDPDGCTFTVVEGVVEITLPDGTVIRLEALQRLRLAIDGDAGDPEDVPLPDLLDDPWIADNLARDEEAGFAAIGNGTSGGVALPEPPDPPTDSTGRPIEDLDIVAEDDEGGLVVVAWDGGATAPVGVSGLGPRWSPDARWIVYGADGDLHVVSPDGSVAAQVTTTPGAIEQLPVWSPDGTEIAYMTGGGHIEVLTLASGSVRSVYDGATVAGAFDWAGPAPGTIVYGVAGELSWAEPDGTVVARFEHGGANSQHVRVSLDGDEALYHLNSADATRQETRLTRADGVDDRLLRDRFTFGDPLADWIVVQSGGGLARIARAAPGAEDAFAPGPLRRPDAWWAP